MSNFDFLQKKYNSYYELGVLAEQYYKSDPPTGITKLRLLIEYITKDIYSENETLDANLSIYEIISNCEEKGYIPEKIVNLLHTIRVKGNAAVHEHKGTASEALELLKYSYFIAFWFYVLRGGDKNLFKPFEKPVSKFEELQKTKLEQENIIISLKQKLEENQKLLNEKQKTEAEIIDFKRKSEEISQYKEIAISEKQTRKLLIDPKLQKAGWTIIDYKANLNLNSLDKIVVREFPTQSGPADYALFVKGTLLGFIEAKKIKVGTQNVIDQTKRYSLSAHQGVDNWRGHKVSFLYSSNGVKVFFLDVRDEKNISREISDFHTPNALEEFYNREKYNPNLWFKEHPIKGYFAKTARKPYPYQETAIESVEQNVIKSKRQILLAMATGTGKTYTTIALLYRLLESKAIKRVLFLVDRKALAAQAVTAFNSFETPKGNKFIQEYEVYSQKFKKEDFEEDEKFDLNILPNEYLTNPQAKHTFVYVSTIQRMTMNLKGKYPEISNEEGSQEYEIEVDKLDIPIHAFDMIIVDECHRGYTSKETNVWRETIKHFDAFKVGLTATPALHTVSYFGDPVFKYSIEKAVEEGFLVDQNDPILIKSNVRIEGVFLREGEEVEVIDTDTGSSKIDQLEDERTYDSTEVEKKITVPDSNKKIIQEIKKYLEEHEKETGRFPKTLIFAANDLNHTSHADELVKICKEEFYRGDDFVAKITGKVDRPLQKIRQFRNRPDPKIVVTVDMLTTGVDIPSLEFLVFLRPVKSRILWEQMLGRATRTCKDIYKTGYTVVDCFEGTLIEHFSKVSNFDYKNPQKESLSIAEIIEKIYKNEDREYYLKALIRRLRKIEKNMSGEAYEHFETYIDNGDIGKFADELKSRISGDFLNTMKVLRNKDFQDLLVNYPRAKRGFVRANEYEDTVSSEKLIRRGQESMKPQDYLEVFCKFIKDNPEHVEAIKILLERPKDWKPEVLNELQIKLKQNKFTVKELQKAYNLRYHKALADIISMVKHAAKEEEPILTAEERVTKAINKVCEGKEFNLIQKNWLELIKTYLIENLSIDITDFEVMPVFTDKGGLTIARKVFKNELEKLIMEINSSIAA